MYSMGLCAVTKLDLDAVRRKCFLALFRGVLLLFVLPPTGINESCLEVSRTLLHEAVSEASWNVMAFFQRLEFRLNAGDS